MVKPLSQHISMRGIWHTYRELDVLLRYLDEWFLVKAAQADVAALGRAQEARRELQAIIRHHLGEDEIEYGREFNNLVTALDNALRALDSAAATHPPSAGEGRSHNPPGAQGGGAVFAAGAGHGFYYLDC
ncbi:MAG: hypothetical protein WBS54_01320 [Acidobacteriota bacterium]